MCSTRCAEYRLPVERALGRDPARPGSGRPKMMEFSDRIPTMRLAADMKTALFRNAQRVWTLNDLYDIDALSLAIPYCHVVVIDKDAADRARRTKGDERHGTAVLNTFGPCWTGCLTSSPRPRPSVETPPAGASQDPAKLRHHPA
jgi:hypothetical protein